MSEPVVTDIGRFRCVSRDGEIEWLFECPGCGQWASLDDDQWHGRVSVDHAADGCAGGYHETHDYLTALRAAVVAASLTGQNPFTEDKPDCRHCADGTPHGVYRTIEDGDGA